MARYALLLHGAGRVAGCAVLIAVGRSVGDEQCGYGRVELFGGFALESIHTGLSHSMRDRDGPRRIGALPSEDGYDAGQYKKHADGQQIAARPRTDKVGRRQPIELLLA